jgi:hypothetical protein
MENSQFQPTEPLSVIPPDLSPSQFSPQKNILTKIAFLVGSLVLLGMVGLGGYFLGNRNATSKDIPNDALVQTSPVPTASEGVCTLDVMICPDGSSVGRIAPNCEFEACPSSENDDTKTYTGRFHSFSLRYPSTYTAEIDDVKDTNHVIEQVIFKDPVGLVEEFVVRVDAQITSLPEYPYDQLPTGRYTLDGVAGIYLELPQGYGDGGNWKPRPTTYLFFNNNAGYELTFYGVSNINDPYVQQILNGFSFSK